MQATQVTKQSFLDKTFKLKENKTNIRTEVLAGTTTFMTMAYILVVNSNILADAGMDKGAAFTATAIGGIHRLMYNGYISKLSSSSSSWYGA